MTYVTPHQSEEGVPVRREESLKVRGDYGGGVHCSIPRVSKKIFANRKCRQIGREGGKPDQGLVDQCPQLSQRLTLQGIVFSEPQGSPTRPCSVSLRRARQSWADSSRSGKGLQNVTILMD